jgi:O-antigen biosynthesis protein
MPHTEVSDDSTSEEPDRDYWERYDHPIDLDNPGDSRAVVLGCLSTEPQRVLELGCSTGAMTRVLTERGHRVTAVEVDPVAARVAAPFADHLIVGDLDRVESDGQHLLSELEPAHFDTLIAADVLEHLRDPVGCLQRMRSLLKPEGNVVLSIPNVAHGDVRLALLAGNFDYSDYGLLDRTHVHMFTLDALVAMIRDVGLAPVEWNEVRLPLGTTEISIDENLLEFGRRILCEDPEAETYQWILRCQDVDVAGSAALWRGEQNSAPVAEQTIAIMNAPVAHPGAVEAPEQVEIVGTSSSASLRQRLHRLLGGCRDRLVAHLVR